MSELLNHLIHDARIWQGHRQTRTSQSTESTGYHELDRQLGAGGWPVGALTECLMDGPGIGELQLLLPMMQRLSAAGRTIFWINPPYTPYAPALFQSGVALSQVVVIHPGTKNDTLWTLENCLRSPVTGLVLAWPGQLASRDTRRLQLAAEAGQTSCIVFRSRQAGQNSSPAALRLELSPAPRQGLQVQVLKRRGGWPGQSCQLALGGRAGLASPETSRIIPGPWSGVPA